MKIQKVSLLTINDGAAVELFNEEFKKVLANINDINMKGDASREIVMSFKIQPDKSRRTARVTIQAKTKLASISSHESSVFLKHNLNNIEAFVTNPEQMGFEFDANKTTPENPAQ